MGLLTAKLRPLLRCREGLPPEDEQTEECEAKLQEALQKTARDYHAPPTRLRCGLPARRDGDTS